MNKKLFLSVVLLAASCAKGPDKDTKAAEENFKELSESQKATCNGQGTEFSGIYSIEADTGEAKCSDNGGGQTLGVGFTVNCAQKDDSFKCKTRTDEIAIDGCINQDGSFTIASQTDLGSFEKLSFTVGAEKTKKLTMLKGKIEGDSSEAVLEYSSISSRRKKKKSCNFKWTVAMELRQKLEE